MDFTSIEMTMELDQPPHIVNVLVFCDHLMKHIMVYVALDQTAKTVARFLWQGYILIFRAPANLWVTEELTLRATSSVSCVSSWASGR